MVRLTLSQRAALLALIELQLEIAQQLAPRRWVRKLGTLQDSLVSGKGRIDKQPHRALSSCISLSHFKDKLVCVFQTCYKDYSDRRSS